MKRRASCFKSILFHTCLIPFLITCIDCFYNNTCVRVLIADEGRVNKRGRGKQENKRLEEKERLRSQSFLIQIPIGIWIRKD